MAGGEESVQQLPSSVVADVADGEDKYVAAFKEKMDEAVDKSMIKSRVQDLPLDKLLKTLQVHHPPLLPNAIDPVLRLPECGGETDGTPERGGTLKAGECDAGPAAGASGAAHDRPEPRRAEAPLHSRDAVRPRHTADCIPSCAQHPEPSWNTGTFRGERLT